MPEEYRTSLETIVIGAAYVTGGIAVKMTNLQFVHDAIVQAANAQPYIPYAKASGGTLFVGFGTIAGTVAGTGEVVELAASVGSIAATVSVFAQGY